MSEWHDAILDHLQRILTVTKDSVGWYFPQKNMGLNDMTSNKLWQFQHKCVPLVSQYEWHDVILVPMQDITIGPKNWVGWWFNTCQ